MKHHQKKERGQSVLSDLLSQGTHLATSLFAKLNIGGEKSIGLLYSSILLRTITKRGVPCEKKKNEEEDVM